MNLQHIVDMLSAEGFGDEGITLFRHFLPAEVEEGIVVTSQMPVAIDKYTEMRRGEFQIIVRGRKYDDVRVLSERILNFLKIDGYEDEGIYLFWIRPKHYPLLYPKAESNLIEGSVNYEFAFRLTT